MDRVRLATWNIHGCIGVDRRYAPDRVAAVLEDLAADVIALQEVDDRRPQYRGMTQFDYLRHATGLNGVAGPNIRAAHGEYGNAILTRWPIRAARQVDLSVHRYEPRGALDVDLEGPQGPLRVITVHLGLRRAERARQLDWLLAVVAEHPQEGLPLVLMGDFNEWFLGAGGRLMALDDHFRSVFAPKTFPAPFPVAALDRIYVHPEPAASAPVTCPHPAMRYCSDHLPVIVDVQWPVARSWSAAERAAGERP